MILLLSSPVFNHSTMVVPLSPRVVILSPMVVILSSVVVTLSPVVVTLSPVVHTLSAMVITLFSVTVTLSTSDNIRIRALVCTGAPRQLIRIISACSFWHKTMQINPNFGGKYCLFYDLYGPIREVTRTTLASEVVSIVIITGRVTVNNDILKRGSLIQH